MSLPAQPAGGSRQTSPTRHGKDSVPLPDPCLASTADEQELLEALLASVHRALPADGPAAGLEARVAELGLHELGALDPGWSDGTMGGYARALSALARHHGTLARMAAASNLPPEVAAELPGITARRKAVVDGMAVLAGRLTAAVDRAEGFAGERILFRRRLAEVPAVRDALERARAAVARAHAALAQTAHAAGAPDPAAWAAFAAVALETASAMVQLMGGTGLMEESGMPALYREVLSVIGEVAAALEPRSPQDALHGLLLTAPGPGGIPLDTEGEHR